MSIEVEPYPPAPGGMNTAIPPWEIDDTEAQYIQDGLMDKPGLCRRRGPLVEIATMAAPGDKVTNLITTLDPQGTTRIAALTGNASAGYLEVYSDDRQSTVGLVWPHALPTDPATSLGLAYRKTAARSAQGGGSWIGVTDREDSNSPLQGLALWKGGCSPNYTTGTVSLIRGSAVVTGNGTTWLGNVTPGMFLFASTDDGETDALIGTVKSVNNNTSITLEKVSPYPATAKSYYLQAVRGFAPKVGSGLITCSTTGTQVNGGDTKFKAEGLDAGSWRLYRRGDLAYVGKVSSVASDTQLTLTANAAINLADEPYIALRADSDYSIETTTVTAKVGWLTSAYAERQFYANNGSQYDKTYRLWYSDTDDPEIVDMSEDGSWIEVNSTGDYQEPIRALGAAYNALVVLKDTEAFALTGASPASFSIKKLWDDGCLAGGSVQLFGGGIIWAGRSGINFYDGVTVTNLTLDRLGEVWKNTLATFDSERYRMWSMIVRDHYMLFIERIDPTIAITKGSHKTTPKRWTLALNMTTRAVSLQTNLDIRGSIKLPSDELEQVWFAVNSATGGHIVSGDALFDVEGIDAFACDGNTQGPDFYFESKKFNQGDPLRLKRFKQLAIYYLSQGGALNLDTVVGLNNVGEVATSNFPASVYTWTSLASAVSTWTDLANTYPTWTDLIQGIYVPKRIRFLKRTQHFSFRLYQASPAIERVRFGPYEIGWKWMRPGRV